METQTQEARIIKAIKAIRLSKKIICYKAAELYRVLYLILTDKINGRPSRNECQLKGHNLTKLEEEVIV